MIDSMPYFLTTLLVIAGICAVVLVLSPRDEHLCDEAPSIPYDYGDEGPL